MNANNQTRPLRLAQVSMVQQPEHVGSGIPNWLYCCSELRTPELSLRLDGQALAAILSMTPQQIGELVLFGVLRSTAPHMPWHSAISAVAEHGHEKPDRAVLKSLSATLRRCALANKNTPVDPVAVELLVASLRKGGAM